MNETVQNLINAIKSGDALATEQSFSDAMAEKLSTKIEQLRGDIAKNMFVQPEPVAEEIAYISEEEYNALSEEEKANYQEIEVELEEGIINKAFGVVNKVADAAGDVVKGTAGLAGKAVGGVAKTVGAIRQTPAAIGGAYNVGRGGAQKAIVGR
jgi:hypothetical protein